MFLGSEGERNMRRRGRLVLPAALLCSSCGYTVVTVPETQEPDNGRGVAPAVVSRAPPPPGSRELGQIDARQWCTYDSLAACHEALGAEAASRFGANYVQLVDDGRRVVTWCSWSAARCSGVAYRSAAFPSARRSVRVDHDEREASDRGCTKDVDCEGDRVCTAGRCAEPAKR